MSKLQPHLKIKPGDVAPYVFLPGDQGRIQKIIKHWDEAHEVAFNREFLTYTGKYKGIPVSVTSTGIGCPSAAITVEELINCGAKVFIRVGTCGVLKKGIEIGDVVIPERSLRFDGTTKEYVDEDFEAKPDEKVYAALIKAVKILQIKYFTGVNRTHDAFYETTENFLKLRELPEYKEGKLISSDMEYSAVLTIAKIRGLQAGGVLAVNTVEPLEEIAKNPNLIYQLETTKKAEQGVENAVLVALKAVEILNNGNK